MTDAAQRRDGLARELHVFHGARGLLAAETIWRFAVPEAGFLHDSTLKPKLKSEIVNNVIKDHPGPHLVIGYLWDWGFGAEGIAFTDTALFVTSPKNSERFSLSYDMLASATCETDKDGKEKILLTTVSGTHYVLDSGVCNLPAVCAFLQKAIASNETWRADPVCSAAIAALINAVFGLLTAWTLTRYRFPLRGVLDALIDLPFALPTAVAGIALSALYAQTGWLGAPLARIGLKVAYTPLGIIIALVFIGLPFVVRTIEPVLAEMSLEAEEAAATLGATRFQTLVRVVLPTLAPALLAGTTLAFARAVGEYGSVIFIAGNLPMVSEIAPLLIVIKLEEFDYAGASAIGVIMLVASFAILLAVNFLQRRLTRR